MKLVFSEQLVATGKTVCWYCETPVISFNRNLGKPGKQIWFLKIKLSVVHSKSYPKFSWSFCYGGKNYKND